MRSILPSVLLVARSPVARARVASEPGADTGGASTRRDLAFDDPFPLDEGGSGFGSRCSCRED